MLDLTRPRRLAPHRRTRHVEEGVATPGVLFLAGLLRNRTMSLIIKGRQSYTDVSYLCGERPNSGGGLQRPLPIGAKDCTFGQDCSGAQSDIWPKSRRFLPQR